MARPDAPRWSVLQLDYEDPVLCDREFNVAPDALEKCQVYDMEDCEGGIREFMVTEGSFRSRGKSRRYAFTEFFARLCEHIGFIHRGSYPPPNDHEAQLLFLLLRTSLFFMTDLSETTFDLEECREALRLSDQQYESLFFGQHQKILDQASKWDPIFEAKVQDVPNLKIEWPQVSPRIARGMLNLLHLTGTRLRRLTFFQGAWKRLAVAMPMVVSAVDDDNDQLLRDLIHVFGDAYQMLTTMGDRQLLLKSIFSAISARQAAKITRRLVYTTEGIDFFALNGDRSPLLATILACRLQTAYMQNTTVTPVFWMLREIANQLDDLELCFRLVSTHRLLAIMPELFYQWHYNEKRTSPTDDKWFDKDHLFAIKRALVNILVETLINISTRSRNDEDRILTAQLLEWVSAWVQNQASQLDLALRWASVATSDEEACKALRLLRVLVEKLPKSFDTEKEFKIEGVGRIKNICRDTCKGAVCFENKDTFLQVADALLDKRFCPLEEEDAFLQWLLYFEESDDPQGLENFCQFFGTFFGIDGYDISEKKITASVEHPLDLAKAALPNSAFPQNKPLAILSVVNTEAEVHHPADQQEVDSLTESSKGRKRKVTEAEDAFLCGSKRPKFEFFDEIIADTAMELESAVPSGNGPCSSFIAQDLEKTPTKKENAPAEEPKVPEKVTSDRPSLRAMTDLLPEKMFLSRLAMEVDLEELPSATLQDEAAGTSKVEPEAKPDPLPEPMLIDLTGEEDDDLWQDAASEPMDLTLPESQPSSSTQFLDDLLSNQANSEADPEPMDTLPYDYELTEDEEYMSAEEVAPDQSMDTTPEPQPMDLSLVRQILSGPQKRKPIATYSPRESKRMAVADLPQETSPETQTTPPAKEAVDKPHHPEKDQPSMDTEEEPQVSLTGSKLTTSSLNVPQEASPEAQPAPPAEEAVDKVGLEPLQPEEDWPSMDAEEEPQVLPTIEPPARRERLIVRLPIVGKLSLPKEAKKSAPREEKTPSTAEPAAKKAKVQKPVGKVGRPKSSKKAPSVQKRMAAPAQSTALKLVDMPLPDISIDLVDPAQKEDSSKDSMEPPEKAKSTSAKKAPRDTKAPKEADKASKTRPPADGSLEEGTLRNRSYKKVVTAKKPKGKVVASTSQKSTTTAARKSDEKAATKAGKVAKTPATSDLSKKKAIPSKQTSAAKASKASSSSNGQKPPSSYTSKWAQSLERDLRQGLRTSQRAAAWKADDEIWNYFHNSRRSDSRMEPCAARRQRTGTAG